MTDAPTRNGPAPDGPAPDGPAPDGPAPDGPAPDGPAPDGRNRDGRNSDGRAARGPAPDGVGPIPRGSALGLRLALAFISVALIAVALLAGLTAAFSAADISSLATSQHTDLTSAIATAAAVAWERNDSWAGADLSPVLDLASLIGADVQIRDLSGHVVTHSPGYAAQPRPAYGAAIMVRHHRVGQTDVRFTGSGLGSADRVLKIDLLRAIAGAAGLAALLAMLTGLAVSRRITRPVEQIIAVTRAVGRGQRAARVGTVSAPGELRELASAFDQMADTMDRQEQLRRDLVADVAHELRTPLAVLQAGHEALLDEISEPTPEQLSSLRDEVLRLARMVTDLQGLAAADAAVLRLSRHPCDLADITAIAANSLTGQFEAAGIAVQRRLTAATILGDPHWLHQVVTNLLTNALKFTPAGGRVTIAAGPVGADAVLTITDTGTGIPADELPRIFDRFWRGRQAAQVSGSGIGLAVASELTRAQGGQLSASSQPGQGTEMRLTLPLAGGGGAR
jgi:two-component system sensor histidine kinase BaeS